jgi:ketosteroid isomerase-like protein
MSQENVRVVRQIYEAYARGDTRALLDAVDPDIRFFDRPNRPGASVYVGREGLLRFGDSDSEVFSNFRYEPVEFVDMGEHVVVRIRQAGRGKASGLPVEEEIVNAWKLHAGRPTEMRVYSDVRGAFEALGLER